MTSNKNGKKATPIGRLGFGPIPSLLIVSRQARSEYLPVLLAFAIVKVLIKDFDFRNLIRMCGSLYTIELKTLRQNDRLAIQLVLEKCNRDSIVSLRRWLDNRASGLDRLPWSYSIFWKPKHQISSKTSEERKMDIFVMRKQLLEQNLEAIAQLHKNVGENLQFELQPVIDAYEMELRRTPVVNDGRAPWRDLAAPSGTMCSV